MPERLTGARAVRFVDRIDGNMAQPIRFDTFLAVNETTTTTSTRPNRWQLQLHHHADSSANKSRCALCAVCRPAPVARPVSFGMARNGEKKTVKRTDDMSILMSTARRHKWNKSKCSKWKWLTDSARAAWHLGLHPHRAQYEWIW